MQIKSEKKSEKSPVLSDFSFLVGPQIILILGESVVQNAERPSVEAEGAASA